MQFLRAVKVRTMPLLLLRRLRLRLLLLALLLMLLRADIYPPPPSPISPRRRWMNSVRCHPTAVWTTSRCDLHLILRC